MLSIFVLLLTVLPAGSTAPHAPMPSANTHRHFHVRVLDRHLDQLIDSTMRRSPTFASLVERLESTDVIVHVDRVMTLPRALRAHIALAGASGGVRYLRIELRTNMGAKETLATLAHELQHAVEIGEAREVRSDAGLCALYHRIGEERVWQQFESPEADAIGRQVQSELIEPHQH